MMLRNRKDGSDVATVAETARVLWREEGLRGFYRGLVARMTSMCSVSLLLVMSYEMMKRVSRVDRTFTTAAR